MRPCLSKAAIVFVLGWSALFAAIPDEAAAQDTGPDVEAQYAGCVLKITCGNDLALNRKTLTALLNSSGVLGAALAEVPDLDEPAKGSANVRISEDSQLMTREGEQLLATALFGVDLFVQAERSQAERSHAERILRGVCRRLDSELKRHSDVEQQHLRTQVAEVRAAVGQAEQRFKELQAVRQELSAAAGQSELSRDVVSGQIQTDERQERELDQQLAGLRARRGALAEQIARIGSQAAAEVEDDPVVVELAKVVELREANLKRWQELVADGRAPTNEQQTAQEALALAKAELARQRQAASQRAGGDLLAELNKELVRLTVDIAAAEAQREFIRQRLTQAREKKLLELADRYEREVRTQLAAAEQVLRDTLKRQADLESRLANYRPPTVTVLGGVGTP